MGAVVDDWPSGNALLQPCRHVLDGLPYPPGMRVSRSLECGSHAAAPAVLTIRCVAYRYPSWSLGCRMCSYRSSSRSGMHAIPARGRLVVRDSCLRTSGHGRHPTKVERNASTQAGSLRHVEHLQPGLTQRDMWVMHSSPAGASMLSERASACMTPSSSGASMLSERASACMSYSPERSLCRV